jgi:phage gpG-like protein
MIAAELGTAALTAWLGALGSKAAEALDAAAADLAAQLLAIAERNLSGEVLNARTGALRASLAASVDPGANLRATVTANTPYAAFQEYGFSGTESVRAHLRRHNGVRGQSTVRAYDRHVDYPAHSYLRAALAELAPVIAASLDAATAKALAP